MEVNKLNYEDVAYDLIQKYCHKPVDSFLEAVGDTFNFRTHKWSVFENENAPLFDNSEKTVWTDEGQNIIDITLDGHGNIGHIECDYALLGDMLFSK